VLGNHDFRGVGELQVKYSEKNPRWIMPKQYYNFSIPYAENVAPLEFIMLHTSVVVCPDLDEVPLESMSWRGECEVLTFSKSAREKGSNVTPEDLRTWANLTTVTRREQLKYVSKFFIMFNLLINNSLTFPFS
jgi:hypothetical protein